MILVYKCDFLETSAPQAAALLTRYMRLNPSLKLRSPGDGFSITIPSGKEPLRTRRALRDLEPHRKWTLCGLDDDGRPVIPISAVPAVHS
jgi:hypothetical protein